MNSWRAFWDRAPWDVLGTVLILFFILIVLPSIGDWFIPFYNAAELVK